MSKSKEGLRRGMYSDDTDTAYGALVKARKKGYASLVEDAAHLLEHDESDIRKQAAVTVAVLDENGMYEESVKERWKNDTDDLVRAAALRAWCIYYFDAGSDQAQKAASACCNLLSDEYNSPFVRNAAHSMILRLTGYLDQFPPEERYHRNPSVVDDVDGFVDWELIDRLVDR